MAISSSWERPPADAAAANADPGPPADAAAAQPGFRLVDVRQSSCVLQTEMVQVVGGKLAQGTAAHDVAAAIEGLAVQLAPHATLDQDLDEMDTLLTNRRMAALLKYWCAGVEHLAGKEMLGLAIDASRKGRRQMVGTVVCDTEGVAMVGPSQARTCKENDSYTSSRVVPFLTISCS